MIYLVKGTIFVDGDEDDDDDDYDDYDDYDYDI